MQMCMHTHTHMYTCMHAHMHTHMHTCKKIKTCNKKVCREHVLSASVVVLRFLYSSLHYATLHKEEEFSVH